RIMAEGRRPEASTLFKHFLSPGPDAPVPRRVSDGIVHFAFVPTYPVGSNGFVPTGNSFTFPRRVDADTVVEIPAYVDIEIGVLEPATLKQFRALKDFNTVAAQNFLRDHVGRIHFFRERVPIRNFVNPYRSNEVP
ncbi:MAG TPA: hypothetical protein VK846_09595, partial [Candidatus Limnocylindria bacterium]|nr:hypothetical protein [Candidatus Limnocylindria bacterium]